METLHPSFALFLLCVSTLFSLSLCFSPIDNHLIDCGSPVDSIVDNRRFSSDSSTSNSHLFSSSRAIFLGAQADTNLPQIYQSARVFKAPSKYVFDVKDPGTHMVRLHFHRFNTPKSDLSNAQFHVLVNDFVVLGNFTCGHLSNPRVIEYLIWVEGGKLAITFVPAEKSKLAFINAIEVISAPKDLILDTAQFVNGDKIENFDRLNKQALQIVYRVNVGGPKVTPFNDTLWRTWVPDDEFFKTIDGSERVYFGGRIHYQVGGASREVGPDNVYNTARLIRSKNASIPNLNLTWEFPVIEDHKYLVRMHFCDIASISLGLLYFNVYVNGHLAYKDVDLTDASNMRLASPFYADFVVDGDRSRVLSVSVGSSSKSMAYTVDAILNGVEIMKMNKSMDSFDGDVSARSVLKCWHKGNFGVLAPLVAVVCLLLIISMMLHRRTVAVIDSVSWTKLPVDIPGFDQEHGKQQFSGKS